MSLVSTRPNTQALKRIREQRGLKIEDVATFVAISLERLIAFESGEIAPSRRQAERLADTYGVPLYSLYSASVLDLPALPQDFRKLIPTPAALSPRGTKILLNTIKSSEFSKQLAIAVNYKPKNLILRINNANSVIKKAGILRSIFDEWLQKRSSKFSFAGPQEQKFMGGLRLFFEVQGGMVHVNDAPERDYLGFYVKSDVGVPAIFVNRSILSRKAQLFTFVHEYYHALVGESGISNPFIARNALERECNIFAAEFLAPRKEFSDLVEGLPKAIRADVYNLIDVVSSKSLLSKHATAIRLVEAGYLNQRQLNSWRKPFVLNPSKEKEEEKNSQSAGIGAPQAKRVSEVGYLSVYLAKTAVENKLIDSFDIAEGLGLSKTLQQRAFKLADRRFSAAIS